MEHSIYRVLSFQIIGDYRLKIWFDDDTSQEIDFKPILRGQIYGHLKDVSRFCQVEIDPEIHTLVWPGGADFDPETLHDWEKYLPILKLQAEKWESAAA